LQVDQRRGEHHAIEPAAAAIGGANEHGGAGGMAEREQRRRTIRHHDLAHEGVEVAVVFGEVAHIAFVAIAEQAFRQALAAPIERRDGKAARAQIAHRLEIFFDPLAAALQNDHRALAPGRRQPTGEAQAHAGGRFQFAGDEIVRDRIGWNGDEFHGDCKRLAA
jgi:hypothetical protein